MSDEPVRVRMKTAMVGEPTYAHGEVVTVSAVVAAAWVADGLADLVDEVAQAPAEAAMQPGGPERAMRPRARRRG